MWCCDLANNMALAEICGLWLLSSLTSVSSMFGGQDRVNAKYVKVQGLMHHQVRTLWSFDLLTLACWCLMLCWFAHTLAIICQQALSCIDTVSYFCSDLKVYLQICQCVRGAQWRWCIWKDSYRSATSWRPKHTACQAFTREQIRCFRYGT